MWSRLFLGVLRCREQFSFRNYSHQGSLRTKVNFSMLRDSKPLGFQHENGYVIFYTFFGYIILFRCGQSFITSKVLSTAFEEVQLSAPLPPPRSDDSAYAPGSYLLTSASGWPFPYLITSLRLCLWVALVRIYYYLNMTIKSVRSPC